jgi:hypothetical protein
VHILKEADASASNRYLDSMLREVIEIELHPNNMNKEDGLHVSLSWKPLIHFLKEHRKPPQQK